MLPSLTVQSPPRFGQDTAPGFALPHRPVYDVANVYSHVYPYSSAFLRAMTTPGTRLDQYKAGTNELSYWLGFRAVSQFYHRAMKRFYDHHPRVAEAFDHHPILLGIPFVLGGIVVDSIGGGITQRTWSYLNDRFLAGTVKRALGTRAADWGAKVLRPVQRVLSHSWVQIGFAAISLGLMVDLVFRLLQDSWASGKRHQAMHQQAPENRLVERSLLTADPFITA